MVFVRSTRKRKIFYTVGITNGVSLDQAISEYNNRIIILSELTFPLNEASFRKCDLVKLPKRIILSDISICDPSKLRCPLQKQFYFALERFSCCIMNYCKERLTIHYYNINIAKNPAVLEVVKENIRFVKFSQILKIIL